jgi:DNA-directed RNA polymerase specialized sigma24 family protein
MALTADQMVSQSNPTPKALSILLRRRQRWVTPQDRRDMEEVARAAWWEAQQQQGASVEDCRKAADSAMTSFRQPRGSRVGRHSEEARRRAFLLENLADDQAGADRPRELAESQWDCDALASLPEDQRSLLEQLVIQGNTYATLSKERGVTVHRVRALETEALAAIGKQIAVLYEQGRVDCSGVTQAGLAFLNWLQRGEPGYREVPRSFDIVWSSNGIETVRPRKTARRNNSILIVNTSEAERKKGMRGPLTFDVLRSARAVETRRHCKKERRAHCFTIVDTKEAQSKENEEWYRILQTLGVTATPGKKFAKQLKRDEVPPSNELHPAWLLSPLDRALFAELGSPVPGPSVTLQDLRELGLDGVVKAMLKYDASLLADKELRGLICKHDELRDVLLEDHELRELFLKDDELRELVREYDEWRELMKDDELRELARKYEKLCELLEKDEVREGVLRDDRAREIILKNEHLRELFPESDEYIRSFSREHDHQ